MERVVGIEPTFPAWKAGVLPIYDTRIFGAKDGTRTRNIHLGKVALYHWATFATFLVGVTGLEPATSWSQTMRATICATPR